MKQRIHRPMDDTDLLLAHGQRIEEVERRRMEADEIFAFPGTYFHDHWLAVVPITLGPLIVPKNCRLVGMFAAMLPGGTATVQLRHDGTLVGDPLDVVGGYGDPAMLSFSPVPLALGFDQLTCDVSAATGTNLTVMPIFVGP